MNLEVENFMFENSKLSLSSLLLQSIGAVTVLFESTVKMGLLIVEDSGVKKLKLTIFTTLDFTSAEVAKQDFNKWWSRVESQADNKMIFHIQCSVA